MLASPSATAFWPRSFQLLGASAPYHAVVSIGDRELQGDAAAHRRARDERVLPADRFQQIVQIAGKEFGRVRPHRLGGRAVPATIIGQDIDGSAERGNDAVPDAAIERERMDKYEARRSRLA
jgi:hypothetical protein